MRAYSDLGRDVYNDLLDMPMGIKEGKAMLEVPKGDLSSKLFEEVKNITKAHAYDLLSEKIQDLSAVVKQLTEVNDELLLTNDKLRNTNEQLLERLHKVSE